MTAIPTAFHDRHVAAGAKMVDFAGYRMPIQYRSILEEHRQVRRTGGIFDVSHMGEFFVSGDGAIEFLNKMTVNNVSKLVDGQVQYSAMMTPEGGIVDDLLVHRFREDHFMLVVNASNREKDMAWLQKHNDRGIDISDRSDDYSLLAVQGRAAYDLVLELAEGDLSDLPYYHFRMGRIGGIELILARTGYTGERGFELYVKNENALALWDIVVPKAKELDILPVGLGARDSLRLEMKFALYGNDIDDSTSTIEAGLGWITKAKKKMPFIGLDVVRKHKSEGPPRRLVGFELEGRGIPRHGQSCFVDDQEVGSVTSGCQSPILEKAIGLVYLAPPLHEVGSCFEVDIRGRRVPARVVPTPFLELEVPCR
jgi:aminomethyltransferase